MATGERWKAMETALVPPDTSTDKDPGTFSFMEYDSGAGGLALPLAAKFPDATILSVDGSVPLTDVHLANVIAANLTNAVVCRREVDESLLSSLHHSPEMLRYQTWSLALPAALRKHGRATVSKIVSQMLDVGVTSFLQIPDAGHLSLALTTLYDSYAWGGGAANAMAYASASRFDVRVHPRLHFVGSETRLVQSMLERAHSHTRVTVAPVHMDGAEGPSLSPFMAAIQRIAKERQEAAAAALGDEAGDDDDAAVAETTPDLPILLPPYYGIGTGLVRVDLVNMTREVNHHFESERDGHERKYSMLVAVNPELSTSKVPVTPLPVGNHANGGGVVSVGLTRAHDSAPIPFDSVHGVSLIAVLRLGLLSALKAKAYHRFVALPLYQDMAPWNIVFKGQQLDYIDYDTKDHTYDELIPMAFEIMEVLFNYKRTVQDFDKCGTKARVLYGFPYVGDCVGGAEVRGGCSDDHARPVPCGDGKCHSDYVSCLRSLTAIENKDKGAVWLSEMAAMRLRLSEHAGSVVDPGLVRAGKKIESGGEDGREESLGVALLKQMKDQSRAVWAEHGAGQSSARDADLAARERRQRMSRVALGDVGGVN